MCSISNEALLIKAWDHYLRFSISGSWRQSLLTPIVMINIMFLENETVESSCFLPVRLPRRGERPLKLCLDRRRDGYEACLARDAQQENAPHARASSKKLNFLMPDSRGRKLLH
jgi:hypothetical protein